MPQPSSRGPRTGSLRRTRIPTTCGSGETDAGLDVLLAQTPALGRGGRRSDHAARRTGGHALAADSRTGDPLMDAFDVLGPLPTGTTVLEASAGTGKTYTVGALVTRYVAEGEATLDEMLVITFGRVASQELRERVREQLVEAERALADPQQALAAGGLIAHLAEGRQGGGGAASQAPGRRAGRVRRRHDRDHPPVLPPRPAVAGSRRRLGLRRGARRVARRARRRGRRRPLPAALRTGRRRATVQPGDGTRAGARCGTRSPGHALPVRGAVRVGRGAGLLRPRGARRDRAPQATARHPVVRRPAEPPGGCAGGAGCTCARPDETTLEGRARR